ncbi:hypothetical protein Taro_008654 [Colocasia esculenta]|uniref:Uncharacterized protein n=1 Tax=Colocasia esculenta TaxID=4460 RepID=A0A843TXU0_COLES|nr:hypothetical protein [Colocasia esculenta]
MIFRVGQTPLESAGSKDPTRPESGSAGSDSPSRPDSAIHGCNRIKDELKVEGELDRVEARNLELGVREDLTPWLLPVAARREMTLSYFVKDI